VFKSVTNDIDIKFDRSSYLNDRDLLPASNNGQICTAKTKSAGSHPACPASLPDFFSIYLFIYLFIVYLFLKYRILFIYLFIYFLTSLAEC